MSSLSLSGGVVLRWMLVAGGRPVLFAAAFVVAVCISILSIEAWSIWTALEIQIGESRTSSTNLAKSLAQHASGIFSEADAVVAGLVERLETDGTSPASIDRIHRLLRREKSHLAQLQRLSVIGADGIPITTDSDSPEDQLSRADYEFFQFHRSHDDDAPHFGPPIKSKSTNEWVSTISRRFKAPNGSFGVAVASLSLSFFSGYYEHFDIGEKGSIVLAMSDGTVLDRRPFVDRVIGTSLADGVLFKSHIAFDEVGVMWIKSQIDSVERLAAYEKVGGFPVYAIVTYSGEQILKDWVEDSVIHATAALLLVVLVAAVGTLLVWQIARRQADQLDLQQSKAALQQLNAKLEGLAREDGLTGLANRREFDRVFHDEVKRTMRNEEPIALIMLDIDHFKDFNDHFGHPRGDQCIRDVASLIKSRVDRPGDTAARYGGEEFVVLLPSTNAQGARLVAEKLRDAVHRCAIPSVPGGLCTVVTVSMGISVREPFDVSTTADELLVQADRALYAAKAAGRDTIRHFVGGSPDSRPDEIGPVSRA